jgi:hypothetical protein
MRNSSKPKLSTRAKLHLFDDIIGVGTAARLLMLKESRIYQLTRANWIKRPFTIGGVVSGYLKFLSDEARHASRKDVNGTVQRERARKFKLANDSLDESLVAVEDVVAMIDAMSGLMKAELQALPAHATTDDVLRQKLKNGIDDVLAGIARRSQRAVDDLVAGCDVADGANGAAADDGADDAEPSAARSRLQ